MKPNPNFKTVRIPPTSPNTGRLPTKSSKYPPLMSIALKCWDHPNHKCPFQTCYNTRKYEPYYTVSPISNLSILIQKIPQNSAGSLRITELYHNQNLLGTYPIIPLYRGLYLNLTTPIWDDRLAFKEKIFRVHLDPSPNLPLSANFESVNIILASNFRFVCEQRDPRGIGTILIVGMILEVFLVLGCCFGCFRLWKVARKRTMTKRMYLGVWGLGIGYYSWVVYGLYRESMKINEEMAAGRRV